MKTEITRFNNDVANNEEMQNKIKEIGSNMEKIIEYANEKGYKFSKEDINEYSNEEITDEELDKVAGGAVVTAIIGAIFCNNGNTYNTDKKKS